MPHLPVYPQSTAPDEVRRAQIILELLHSDITYAFEKDGMTTAQLGAFAESTLEVMLRAFPDRDSRLKAWVTICTQINDDFQGGKL